MGLISTDGVGECVARDCVNTITDCTAACELGAQSPFDTATDRVLRVSTTTVEPLAGGAPCQVRDATRAERSKQEIIPTRRAYAAFSATSEPELSNGHLIALAI